MSSEAHRHPGDERPPAPAPRTGSGADGLGGLLARRRLLVCVGSGGVGKTTTAAALGLLAACRGRHAAVLTVDPARRLRDTLGIAALDGAPHRVPLRRVRRDATGTLDAMLLDAKRTFDELIERHAPSPTAAARVLENRIYQTISTALAGSQEYMAMERLHALAVSGRYDLLVVDTPPTQHALDFLQAPERLSALLSSRAASILQNPASILGRESSRIAQAALGAILRGLERFTGLELLRDVAEFVGGIEHFSEGFQERAAAVGRYFRSADAGFLLVCTAEPARVAESLAFHRELVRAGLPFEGFVVNRVLPPGLIGDWSPDPEREDGADQLLARKLVALQRDVRRQRDAERAEVARLRDAAPDALLVEVVLRPAEPTTLAALVDLLD